MLRFAPEENERVTCNHRFYSGNVHRLTPIPPYARGKQSKATIDTDLSIAVRKRTC